MNTLAKGEQITKQSFEIIRRRLGDFQAAPDVMEIVVRIAHTTGDVGFGTEHHIPQGALINAVQAAAGGCSIITDVEMVRTGIRAAWAAACGCNVDCFLNHPEVVETSRQTGETRSALGIHYAGERLNGSIVAIGNAPTALFALLDLIAQQKAAPALIVGVPVGFVGALESKQALFDSKYPGITNLSERGGSPIAAAIVNGILHLAAQGKKA